MTMTEDYERAKRIETLHAVSYRDGFGIEGIRTLPCEAPRTNLGRTTEYRFPDSILFLGKEIKCLIIGWRPKNDRPQGNLLEILELDGKINQLNDIYIQEINGKKFTAPPQ